MWLMCVWVALCTTRRTVERVWAVPSAPFEPAAAAVRPAESPVEGVVNM
jgi:hypothetical protein